MAYSNWGAFVYKDGQRREDKEDVGAFDTDEANLPSGGRIFANIIKNRERKDDSFYNHSHHAVLGDGEVRLCGYKNYARLYSSKDGAVETIELPDTGNKENDYLTENASGIVNIDDKIWKWYFNQRDINMIDLKLTEPDGAEWTATCGYQYGAGF